MEDFINSFQEKTASQKLLLVVAITVVLLFFISVMFLISTPKQKQVSVNSISPKGNTSIPVEKPRQKFYALSAKGYNVLYPDDFRTEKIATTGSEVIRFIPINNSSGSYDPSLKIKVVDYLPSVFLQIESDEKSSFALENSSFKGISAEKFSGVLRNATGNSTYNTSYLFINKGLIFYIEYFYPGEVSSTVWEERFSQILDNVELQ